MPFIHPMWDHESQRIGMQKCTALGYKLQGIAGLLGFLGLFLLILVCAFLGFLHHLCRLRPNHFWLLGIPLGMGLIDEVLYRYAWRLAERKGFLYDYGTREASWIEDGTRRMFRWQPDASNTVQGQGSPTDDHPHCKKDASP